MASQSWICSVCYQNQAASCCACTPEGSALCSDCISSHYSKAPGLLHITIPAQFFGEHRVTGYFDRLQVRLATIPQRKEKLLSQLGQIEKCYKEFDASIEQIVTAVRDYANRTKESLRQVACELEKSIREGIDEAEKTIYVDSSTLGSRWAVYIRNAGSSAPPPKVFRYSINTSTVIANLEQMLRYTCGMDFETQFTSLLPAINGRFLNLYDIESQVKTRGLLPISFTEGTVCCWLTLDTLLCVGRSPAANTAYAISPATCRTVRKADMQYARSYAGILLCGLDVYLFGGYKPHLSSCEVYDSYEDTWRELGNMNDVRSCFTPCRYRREVFLFDSYISRKGLEIFDLATERFRNADITLSSFSGYSISFIADGDLVIAGKNQTVKLGLDRSYNDKIVKVSDCKSKLPASSPPLVVGLKAYVIDCFNANLYEFDCEENQWTKK